MENSSYKILLVDDDKDIIEFLTYNLRKEGFQVSSVNNGVEAFRLAKETIPHLILLDVMMPEMDGIETCHELRRDPRLDNTLIAFLTARGEDYSQIAGFDAGADDYITKPIKPKVLVSRVKALLKRHADPTVPASPSESGDGPISRDEIVIDREKFLVTLNGQQMVLPKKEFNLLYLLASKPEKVFTREEIYEKVWGNSIVVGDRTIDVHIRKLREKLGQQHFVTVKGVGYKFV